ncbi:hypothetical protein AN958_07546 [Leucoagaricus sp. SymC.cos]|nr:hypothetical protein AN958_07546 [Leucoagaricus sp. SymC.cos]
MSPDSTSERAFPLLSLSTDVILEILSFLTALELTRCRFACRQLYELTLGRSLWVRLYEHGNFGYIAALPSRVDHSTNTKELRTLLARAEMTERQWVGQRPQTHWLGMINWNRPPRGSMGPYFVSQDIPNPTLDGVVLSFCWYSLTAPGISGKAEPTFQYSQRESEPTNFLLFSITRFIDNDSMYLAYGKRRGGKNELHL